MMTTDISLIHDPAGMYQKLVAHYASNMSALTFDFSHVWYKLMTRDMGPVSRCVGPYIPSVQNFQNPLPAKPSNLADFAMVSTTLADLIGKNRENYTGLFVQLAWQCASTFRQTDYLGGCNGARIRFQPQISWTNNVNLNNALEYLQPVKDKYGDGLSWADLIVLAGKTLKVSLTILHCAYG